MYFVIKQRKRAVSHTGRKGMQLRLGRVAKSAINITVVKVEIQIQIQIQTR